MTHEDRELLLSLQRQQADIQQTLDRLNAELAALQARANAVAPEDHSHLPPLPEFHHLPPVPEPPLEPTEPVFPPLPPPHEPAFHSQPPQPPSIPIPTAAPKPSIELRVGRWLTRLGAVLIVIAFVLVDNYFQLHKLLGPWGKLGLGAAVSMILVTIGQRVERKQTHLLFWGRTVMAAGLAGLYVTFYAACSLEGLRVIHSPFLSGLLLLSWSVYVFLLAERKKSQVLSLGAITLAYFSSAINPVNSFTLAADLLLAITAVAFLIRNSWVALSYFSLVGTYAILLRRLILDQNYELVLDTSRTLHFWPYVTYLYGAWLIFTAAVILSQAPTFRGGKRLAFLSLNNGALAGLLALTAYISGYGYSTMGWALLDTGFVFLLASRVAGFVDIDPGEVMAAYAAQGLALITAGIMVVFTGITRGVLLMLETFFLGLAAAFSSDRILIVSTYFSAFFATLFLVWEVSVQGHHPWLLGFGGAAVLFYNAWWSRGEIRHSPLSRSTIVLSSSYYITLALGLLFAVLGSQLSDPALPPVLALTALVLTFSIYYVSLYELPPLAQTFLIAAQGIVLFRADTGEDFPWWTTGIVAATTLLLTTWWTRQRVTRSGSWTHALTLVYALALVGLTCETLHPYASPQRWMVETSFLSIAFLAYGAFTRTWSIAAMGQVFLAIALCYFFFPPGSSETFPWTWTAALVPIVVVLATARATHKWLRLSPELSKSWREALSLLAYGYQLLALGMVIRWIFALVPALNQVPAFLLLGTILLAFAVRRGNTFGIRCSFVLSTIGMLLYFKNLDTSAHAMSTWINGIATLCFLAQPALLRHSPTPLISKVEQWALILFSIVTGWVFLSVWILTRITPFYLTMGWALYALFLFLFGLLVRERRFRWCGLAIFIAAIIRVGCYDFWGLSSGYRVLTFIVLAFISFGLGYIILRYADRAKTWL